VRFKLISVHFKEQRGQPHIVLAFIVTTSGKGPSKFNEKRFLSYIHLYPFIHVSLSYFYFFLSFLPYSFHRITTKISVVCVVRYFNAFVTHIPATAKNCLIEAALVKQNILLPCVFRAEKF
jgi:hypothetical protein